MDTADSYREFALECARWAESAGDEELQKTLLDMARLWMQAAMENQMAAPSIACTDTPTPE